MIRPALFATAALAAAVATAPPAPGSTPPLPVEPPKTVVKTTEKTTEKTKTTFKSVVDVYFAKWDKNHDGKLSVAEVDAAVRDRNLTGSAAAAAAAIHAHLRKPTAGAFVSKTELYAEFKGTESTRPDIEHAATNFESVFATYNGKLAGVEPKVFAKPDAPRLDGMHQGRLGDCFLVASLGSAVNRHPAAVRKLIHETADGTVEVTFPGAHKTVKVATPTAAEVALGSTAGDQGIWLNVVEKAYGEFLIETTKSKLDPHVLPLDIISHGGSAKSLLQALTPTLVDAFPMTNNPPKPPSDAEYKKMEVDAHKHLQEVEGGERVAVCYTMSDSKVPHGVATSHVYAITGYDSGRKVVHLWNPWGTGYDFKLKADQKPGRENGYEVRNGRFDVPLHDFVRIFSSFAYDTGHPVPKAK